MVGNSRCLPVWQLPGNGTYYPLKPGESFIITQEAANHADHIKYG